MKNILKKLGVFGLLVAIILPFVELPIVNAEETDCEKHLQNYMFLDVTSYAPGHAVLDQYEGDGYTTYASFPYIFPDTKYYEIKDIKTSINYANAESTLNRYWSLYNTVYNYSSISDREYYDDDNQFGKEFISNNVGNYDKNTILIHGQWSNYDASGYPIISEWGEITGGKSLSLQNISNLTSAMGTQSVTIDGAKIESGFTGVSETNLADFIKKAIYGEYTESPLWNDSKKTNISFKITRKLSSNTLDNLYFGYKDGSTTYVFTNKYASSTGTDTYATKITKADIENSYTAFKEWSKAVNGEAEGSAERIAADNKYIRTIETTTDILDIDIYKDSKLYWPVVLNVEYTACPLSSTQEPVTPVDSKWHLVYDGNVTDNSVKNVPSKSAEVKVGEEITVDSTKPTREGYIFDGWCENANGSGSCYKAGDKVKSDKAGVKTLYANWDKDGTTENPKQGVISYIIGFGLVGLVAGGIYLASKKKNLFKQI